MQDLLQDPTSFYAILFLGFVLYLGILFIVIRAATQASSINRELIKMNIFLQAIVRKLEEKP